MDKIREQELRALQSFGRADLLDASLYAMDIITGEHEYEGEKEMPADYCPVGSSRCFVCGATYPYPVSGCSVCHRSFCD